MSPCNNDFHYDIIVTAMAFVWKPKIKGGLILIILIVAVALIGIGWNAIRGGKVNEETTLSANLGSQKIERDGVEYTVKDALGGEGVVCMGSEKPGNFTEGYPDETYSYPRLFVGPENSTLLWRAKSFEVPSEGVLCVVLNTDGDTVDRFLGFDPGKISAALAYAGGETPFTMVKKQTAYDIVEGKRALFDEKYLFSVCGNNDPLEGIGKSSDDHLDCLTPLETVEYANLSDVVEGQTETSAQVQEGDLVGQLATSLTNTTGTGVGSFYVPQTDGEEVLVFSLFGTTRVYPIYPLARYPIITELSGELPYSITFDWLTDKVTVFKASINGQSTSIGFAGRVYGSNFLVYDYLTNSWYQQFTGLGVWGDSAGYQLDTLPYQRMTWAEAKSLSNAKYAELYIGEENPDSLTIRAAEYKTSSTINYIVSKAVKDPKKRVEWDGEISNKLGYELFY